MCIVIGTRLALSVCRMPKLNMARVVSIAALVLLGGCELYYGGGSGGGGGGLSPGPVCAAGCLCFTNEADCTANGCPWQNGVCYNGLPPDAGSPDAGSGHDAGSMVDAKPTGSCGGTVTCAIAQPVCPSGEVPTIANGCWTGECEKISSCTTPPACAEINDETDCLARKDCSATFTGIDCTMPDGSACMAGDTNCTCASFVFATCVSK